MEIQAILIKFDSWLHLVVGLITNNMINFHQVYFGKTQVQNLFGRMWLVTRKEKSFVILSFYKCVSCISISKNGWENDWAVSIFMLGGRWDRYCSSFDGSFIDGFAVLNLNGNISDSISMIDEMLIHCLAGIFVVDRLKDEYCAFLVSDNVAGHSSFSCL